MMSKKLTRRDFFKLTGGAVAAAAGAYWLPSLARNVLQPIEVGVANAADPPPDLFFAGTDGWIFLPPSPAIPPYHPDNLAPPPFNTYIFGFRNVTGLTNKQVKDQKMKAQHQAPLFWTRQPELADQHGPGQRRQRDVQLCGLPARKFLV